MKLEECYEAFKGNYKDVMARLPRESSVIKFLRKFAENKDFNTLLEAYDKKDYDTIFATAHNLKGMAANLSISAFGSSISEVCECVRGGVVSGDLDTLIAQAKDDYEITIKAINELED